MMSLSPELVQSYDAILAERNIVSGECDNYKMASLLSGLLPKISFFSSG